MYTNFHLVDNDMLIPLCLQGIMIFLQNPPTTGWGDAEISLMLAEAFRLKFLFAEAPNHLRESTEPPPVLLPHS